MSRLTNRNEELKTIFNIVSKSHPGLQVCCLNARSLQKNKIDFLNYLFSDSNVDLLCITETWFRPELDDLAHKLDAYNCVRHDRVYGSRGGGIALYLKKGLQYKIIMKSDNRDFVEYLGVEFKGNNNTRCFITCVYNPNKSNCFDEFFCDLNKHTFYENIIVCGDFNIDLLRKDNKMQNFVDNITSCGLKIINSWPTRYAPHSRPSLLDVMIASNDRLTNHIDQFPMAGISDHEMLFYSYNIDLNNVSRTQIQFRDFNSIDIASLHHNSACVKWNDVYYYPDVNDKVECLSLNINYLFEKHVPFRTIKIKSSKPPWFSDQIKKIINHRNALYLRWRHDQCELNWVSYKTVRNAVHVAIRNAKSNYYKVKLNCNLPAKQLWRRLEQIGLKKHKTECPIDADIMNNSFLQSNHMQQSDDFTCNPDLLYTGQELNFIAFSLNDVYVAVMSVKSNAVGSDGIHLKFIKIILPFILPVVTHIFNHIVCSGIFPSKWKIANIIPVGKNNSANRPEDFRPISILCAISKVFEKLICSQILQHVCEKNLLSQYQSGFRSGRSCNTAILKVLEDIRPYYDKSDTTILTLIDFSKAFDTVNYNILLQKLKNYYGFSSYSCNLIKSYLSDRSQVVITNGSISSLKPLFAGVPQGSVLGPILFSLFINDITSCCQNSHIHMYADDVQIYLSRPPSQTEDLVSCLNDDLFRINAWSQHNQLLINASKTKALCISPRQRIPLPPLCLQEKNIEIVDNVKNLGFYINSRLNCSSHISFVISRIYCILRKLWYSASLLSKDLKMKLVRVLITPYLTYMANVYSELDAASSKKLQMVVNNCARYIFNKRKYDNISKYSIQILGCNLSSFFIVRNLILVHAIIYTKEPSYLFNKLTFLKSRRTFNLKVPHHNYLVSSRLFFVNAVKYWNNLPHHLKLERRSSVFKAAVISLHSN